MMPQPEYPLLLLTERLSITSEVFTWMPSRDTHIKIWLASTNTKNKLASHTTLRTREWSKNIFTEARLPFLNSVDVKWCQMYMSYLFQNHFIFFFCVFINILFDNVIAIRFTWSLVKYHNCFITIFLKKKKNRKDVSIQTLLAVKTCSYSLSFMLNCMRLLNPRSLIKYQSPEETDESRPLFKVNHKKN